MDVSFGVPTTMYESFSSSALPSILDFVSLHFSHPNKCMVIFIIGFSYIPLMVNYVKHLFGCLLAIFIPTLDKALYINSLPIFICFLLNLESSLYIMGTSTFFRIMVCQYFFLLCSLSFFFIYFVFYIVNI